MSDPMKVQEAAEKLQQAIDSHRRVVFFGGAGVSTESGIPDYRGKDGIDKEGPDEEGYTPEERRYHDYFLTHPDKFHDEFIVRFRALSAVEPNATHYKLAELERAGKLRAVITQNIDGLHHRGGSQYVIELHGNMRTCHCEKCGTTYDIKRFLDGGVRCDCGGLIRPDIVMFGESLDDGAITAAVNEIANADMLIIAGTSLAVYPAAGLVDYFRGDCLVLMDRQKTPRDGAADILIREPIAEVFGKIKA